MKPLRGIALALATVASAAAGGAEARIVRIEVARVEPAFGGRGFGEAGAFERLTGRAHGELDPALPANAVIQDIALAPRNASGMVEYATDIEIVRPADPARSNGVLFFNIVNRGNKGGLSLFNADVPPVVGDINALASAGDGFLQRQGYTMVWFQWQGDVLPGNGRMTMTLPVARNPDGTPITGTVRSEILTLAPATTLFLTSGWFTALAHAPYPSVTTDNRTPLADGFLPTLTVRDREFAPREAIANTEWSFGACPQGGAATANDRQVCYPAGFKPGRIYELTYRARDPMVLGIGFAVARDLGAFLKSGAPDLAGAPNPVRVQGAKAIVMGSSQSGRFIRTMIHLGFNADESGRIVFDGALPHIGGGLIPLNVRFGQPGRSAGTAEVDRLAPGAEYPFAYAAVPDPFTGRSIGLLDRCAATSTCPRIVHAATALEMWELRQSLGFTDPLGMRDLPEPANVRSYILASTQHGAAPLPLPAQEPFGNCHQQQNPNPHVWTMRALLEALAAWVKTGAEPPPSARPTIAEGTLIAADQLRFPVIPATRYGNVARPAMRALGLHNPLHVQDHGPRYDAASASGILDGDEVRQSTARYGNLVAQVDRDGNDLGGIRSVFQQVPIGTYTGWNLFREGLYRDGFCTLAGSFVPFAPTRAERLAAGDPRPSIEERYPDKDAYVAAFRKAAMDLVAQRHLLPADAALLVGQAEREGIRQAP